MALGPAGVGCDPEVERLCRHVGLGKEGRVSQHRVYAGQPGQLGRGGVQHGQLSGGIVASNSDTGQDAVEKVAGAVVVTDWFIVVLGGNEVREGVLEVGVMPASVRVQ